MTSKFQPGDLVWAKIKYSPAWPAKVVDPPEEKSKKNSSYVFFYGSENYAWINESDICLYAEHCMIKRDFRNSLYRKAVKKISEVYHEEVQKRCQFDLFPLQKQKRSKEEEEERRRKIQNRLKVRLFPKKNGKLKKRKKSSAFVETPSVQSTSISSQSSCIITVNVKDYKKVIPFEAVVYLRRCDEGLPVLKSDSDEPECCCQEDLPPTLLPEL